MKKIKLKVLKLVAMVIALLFVISCGAKKNESEKKSLVLAASSFNFDEVNNKVALDALKAKGYDVKVIVLEDATTMNEAAMKGDIDASLHQHKPWMDSYNKSKNREMVMLEPYIHYNVLVCIHLNLKMLTKFLRMQKLLFLQTLVIQQEH